MSRTSRRARCEATANEVDIPRPFDLDALCARIAERRGRPLRLVPLEGTPDADTPCGVWVATRTTDLIFYEPATSAVHKLQIVLHEIAHLLLGHGGSDREQPGYVGRLLRPDHPTHAHRPSGPAPLVREEGGAPAPLQGRPAEKPGLRDELTDQELDLDQLLHVLGRTSYTDEEERDAELLATLLSDRVLSVEETTRADGRRDRRVDVLDRLNDAFGHPLRG